MQSPNNLKLEDEPWDKKKKSHPAFSGFFLQSETSEVYKKYSKKSFIQNEGVTAGKWAKKTFC